MVYTKEKMHFLIKLGDFDKGRALECYDELFENADFTGFVGYKNCRCECYYIYQNTPYEWNKIIEI